MEQMGVLFPIMTTQKVICPTTQDTSIVMTNTRNMTRAKQNEFLSRFLLCSDSVPHHIRGEQLDAYEGTMETISAKVGVDVRVLQARAKERCAVCLEAIKDATVTQCGHVYCILGRPHFAGLICILGKP